MADENEINKKTEDLKNSMGQSEEALKNLAKLFGKNADDMRDAWSREAKSREEYRKKTEKSYDNTKTGIDNLRNKLNAGATTAQDFEAELGRLRDEVNKTSDKVKKAQLLKEKQDLEAENSRLKVNEIFKNSMGELGGTVIKGVANSFTSAAKSALGGGDALKVATDFMSSNIDTANAATQVGAKALGDFGAATAGAGGKMGKFGVAASVAGAALGFLSNSVSELAKAGIGFMLSQTQKMIAGFSELNNSGAVFSGGMLKMVETATTAGMTLEQFSKSVSANKDILSKLGIGVGEASKKLAGAMAAGGESARKGMFALGMNMEQQADAYAQTMAMMAGPSGKLKASQAEIAAQTEDYAKNLKILSALTGEDTKAKQDKLRQDNDTLAFNQQLDGMNETERKKINEAMMNMSADQQRAFRERMIYGTLVSKDLAITEATNSGIATANEQSYKAALDGSLSAQRQQEIQKANAKEAHDAAMANKALAQAGSEDAKAAAASQNASFQYMQKFNQTEEERAKIAAELEKGKTAKPGTKGNEAVDLMQVQQNFALKMQDIAAENLPQFSKAIVNTIKDIEGSVKALADLGLTGATMPPWVASMLGIGAALLQIVPALMSLAKGGGAAGGGGIADAVGKAGGKRGLLRMAKGAGAVGALAGGVMAVSDYQDIKAQEAAGTITAEDAKKAKGGVIGEAGGGIAGAAAGAAAGAIAGSVVPLVGTAIGGIIGGILGGWGGGKAGKAGGEAVAGHFAEGGIATGPASGYMAMLHNRELVLPLTDSGTPKAGTHGIDELMKMMGMGGNSTAAAPSGDVAELIKEQNSKLDDLIKIMGDNRDYTERLMHNMS